MGSDRSSISDLITMRTDRGSLLGTAETYSQRSTYIRMYRRAAAVVFCAP
jgi:hypothetical protein